MTETARDVFLPVASQPSLDALVEEARRAERLGYDRVWMPETWGRDAVTVLTSVARETDRVGVGTSILPVYSRSPALLGQTAATLQEAAGGRFRLGLGPSGPAVIEGWHGRDYRRPLRYTRETIEVVRRVLSGDPVSYHGEIHDLEGFRLRFDPPADPPPIDAAGMGPKAVELAGRFADGWHALFFTREGFRERLDDLRRGAELADRDPSALRTTLSIPCCALDDGERARSLVRRHVAFYVGGMGTFYRDSLARQGYEEVARAVAERWREGDREGAEDALDDDLLDRLAAAGTPGDVRRALDRFAALDGVDAVSVSFPRGATPEEIAATVEALAPGG
ncbi:MAG: TIGR04024 family LLM class F420-dependent oxidoreductase [Salinigranum sp.]